MLDVRHGVPTHQSQFEAETQTQQTTKKTSQKIQLRHCGGLFLRVCVLADPGIDLESGVQQKYVVGVEHLAVQLALSHQRHGQRALLVTQLVQSVCTLDSFVCGLWRNGFGLPSEFGPKLRCIFKLVCWEFWGSLVRKLPGNVSGQKQSCTTNIFNIAFTIALDVNGLGELISLSAFGMVGVLAVPLPNLLKRQIRPDWTLLSISKYPESTVKNENIP